ncbi:beta-glucosidase BglX [Bacteroides sp.]|uniref:beta-glucosidase BglX n=1 Tax=Bacteroides sp. TaxID=29523 RepID=UPI00262F5712|nr:beta-glucosidase BglX [Bacteroides sp.]
MQKLLILLLSALYPCLVIQGQKLIYKDAKQPIEVRVNDLLERMTLHEKILQLNQYTFGENDNPNNIGTEVKNLPADIGSLIYLHTDPKLRNQIQRKAMEESRLGIPILFGFDVIHGLRTVYPISLAQACSFNPELVTQACRIAAKEAVLSGIDWTFSPMIDVARDPRWGRISECYGEDPYLNAILGVASVKGYQGKNLSDPYSIAACLKHFVGYGASEGGRDYRYTDISAQTLWETYLPPYEACVRAGAVTLMSAFNDISGIPATANQYILTDILKKKWQFDGFVVSDWNAIEQLIYQGVAKDKKDAAYKAFQAGVEMDMRDNLYYEYLEQLIAEKRISIAHVDDAVVRILRLKFRLGLFDEPYTKELNESDRYLQNEDVTLAAGLSEESMVLLKNNNNLLPLSSTVRKIAVIGPLAKDKSNLLGAWAFKGQEEDVETIYEGMQKVFGAKIQLSYTQGCALDGENESGFSTALQTGKAADLIVVCLGESKQWSGENASRSTIALPAIQEKLLLQLKRANKPIVLLLSNGRPLDLSRLEPQVNAIIEMWQPGIAGGTPLAKILAGEVNPSGKLSITFPRSTGQIPIYYNMRQPARPFDAMGDYQDISTEPMYPFGYGLSYTTFTYSNAKLSSRKINKGERISAEVTVTNTGKVAGKETVLWYISDPVCSVSRPIKELKFFEKQSLEAGESKVFLFEIDPVRDLSYADATGHRFLEDGEFVVQVGDKKLVFEVMPSQPE